jgi:hypothetical protein
VREVLAHASADTVGRTWASLSDVLPLLAEAAPDEFLNAVREGLHGDAPLMRRLFTDEESDPIFSLTSPHVYLLWALEGLAWSRDFFGQSVDLLAGLAELDPGSKRNGNRPFGSLEAIFCPWHPNTSVGIEGRLAAIDGLRARHSSVAWRLMVSLLPRQYGISVPTHEPAFRDWKPQQVSVLVAEY